ncbi:MAG: ABC transporter ATP-binding protein [Pseudomonadota bacterium]
MGLDSPDSSTAAETRLSNPAISVRNVVKRYGSVTALKGASLEIADNEFFTLLGPSGCGKTTLLRLIAGFEDITEGEIRLFGDEIASLPPNRRPVNTVFQQYALFPHMTVAENVAFGLICLKHPKAEIEPRVNAMLDLVKLGAYAGRKPSQLSGGQQQRVALARAMAPGPKVLLLDEPLSALDLKLRQAMRVELKQLQQDTGITFVFVTHDQEEALTMSDRIAIMSDGEIQQTGSAHDIYENPVNRFVADFIGETNLLDVQVEMVDGSTCQCRLPGGVMVEAKSSGQATAGKSGHVSIRPERVAITASGTGLIEGTIERQIYLGTDTQHLIRLDDGTLITARAQNAHQATVDLSPGDRAGISIDPGAVRLLID